MFSKNKKNQQTNNNHQPRAVPSIISADLKIIGDLSSSGEIQIDGEVSGDIRSKVLLVGEGASIKGEIRAETVRVHGHVNGQIKATFVNLAKTAHVVGDILHENLSIQEGAFLEGHITHILVDEGPFPDLTETMDIKRRQPVIEINRITHRRTPIFHALLPGGLEHRHLMGIPREPTIFAAVNEVCHCTGVYITPGGASWLHAVVQIKKQHDEDGQKAIQAAFRGHTSLKHVVVVDTDVDIYNSADVEWAIATRFQADRDLIIFTDQPSSSLDPSATKVPGQKARTSKMGLNATAPLGETRREYERAEYEPVDLSRYGIKDKL